MTRPPNDPLTNPQPGDVIKSPSGAKRTVKSADTSAVWYLVEAHGLRCDFICSPDEWRIEAKTAEVLHVAE